VALRLARAGVGVTLLDAASFPRSKPCGDCLSPGATPLLRELGVAHRLDAAGAGRVGGWRMRTPGGTWFGGRFDGAAFEAGEGGGGDDRDRGDGRDGEGPSPGAHEPGPPAAPPAATPPATGYALPREELDALLLEAAAEAGARIRERVRVTGLLRRDGRVCGVRARDRRGREEDLPARVVVGADGLRSLVARRLGGVERGPRPRLALVGRFRGVAPPPADVRSPTPGATAPPGEMRLGGDGCLGMAPLGLDRWNVTLVVPADRASAVSRDRDRFFRERLGAYGVRDRFRDAEAVGPLEITGPFRVRPRRTAAPGALLVGDAAGYFDPLTGQGIYRALATARAAAGAVREILEAAGEAEREAARVRYRRELRRIVLPSHRVQKLIDEVTRRGPLIEAAGHLLRRQPGLAHLLVDVTGDRVPPVSLLDPRRLVRALRAA
jgi:flavin-dependent dehydrogenase